MGQKGQRWGGSNPSCEIAALAHVPYHLAGRLEMNRSVHPPYFPSHPTGAATGMTAFINRDPLSRPATIWIFPVQCTQGVVFLERVWWISSISKAGLHGGSKALPFGTAEAMLWSALSPAARPHANGSRFMRVEGVRGWNNSNSNGTGCMV